MRGHERLSSRKRRRFTRAGQYRHTERFGQRARLQLVTEQAERVGVGADEYQAGRRARLRKAGVLGEETVARVHPAALGLTRNRQQRLDVQVSRHAFAGQRTAQGGAAGMQGIGIVAGMDGHCREAQVVGRTGNADRDFAAIGDQQPHDFSSRRSTLPAPVAGSASRNSTWRGTL